MNTYPTLSRLFFLLFFAIAGCTSPSFQNEEDFILATETSQIQIEPLKPTPFPPDLPPIKEAYPYPIFTPIPTRVSFQAPPYPPPVFPVETGTLPHLSADLLFLDEGKLIYWSRNADQFSVLAGGENDHIFLISPNVVTQQVALLHAQNPFNRELLLLDLQSLQFSFLAELGSSFPLGLSLSPDGAYLAYILPDAPSGTDCRPVNDPPDPEMREECAGTVYLLPVDAPGKVHPIGTCAVEDFVEYKVGCNSFIWASNSQSIYWNDGNGLWQAGINTPPELLIDASSLNDYLPGIDARQFINFVDWSPGGRYMSVEVQYKNGWGWAVFDGLDEKIIQVPGLSFFPFQRITWMQGERLFTLQPAGMIENIAPTGALWHLELSARPALIQDSSFSIPITPDHFVFSPIQLPDSLLAFAAINNLGAEYAQRGIYMVSETDFVIRKTSSLPPGGIPYMYSAVYDLSFFWTPDGNGAIFKDDHNRNVFYVTTLEDVLYNLNYIISEHATNFTWITP